MTFTRETPMNILPIRKQLRPAETVTAVAGALEKGAEETRIATERFYNNLALFSGGLWPSA